ncbi:MAG: hypothetical protein AAFY35_04225 [Pseudomonadota bacterium]
MKRSETEAKMDERWSHFVTHRSGLLPDQPTLAHLADIFGVAVENVKRMARVYNKIVEANPRTLKCDFKDPSSFPDVGAAWAVADLGWHEARRVAEAGLQLPHEQRRIDMEGKALATIGTLQETTDRLRGMLLASPPNHPG